MIDLYDILEAANGQLFGEAASQIFTDFCFDSRRAEPGQLFVAVKTKQGDGHDYMQDAVERGVTGIMCTTPPTFDTDGLTVIVMRDVETALVRWTERILQKFGTSVIAVTGSTGKTTTKEAIATVLSSKYNVFKSPGSYNGRFGLPLALGQLTADHQLAVLEFATDQFGEMAEITAATHPVMAVVTNVGHTHIDRLGSVMNVANEYRALIEGLPADGIAILNYDDPLVRSMKTALQGSSMTVSVDLMGDVFGADLTAYNVLVGRYKTGFDLRFGTERHVGKWIPLLGSHQLYASLMAVAVGLCFDVPIGESLRSLTELKPLVGRMNLLEGINGSQIIDDTYSATPESTMAALDWLDSISHSNGQHLETPPFETEEESKKEGKTFVIMGDLSGLGTYESRAYREIGSRASVVADVLVTKGDAAGEIGRAAEESGMLPVNVHMTFSSSDAVQTIKSQIGPKDIILIKGSETARMEHVVQQLLAAKADQNALARSEAAFESVWMDRPSRPTWLNIDMEAIANNVRLTKQMLNDDVALMAVVKANAYGHGAVAVSTTALLNGATYLGVASINEAVELRDAGITAPILILGYTPPWAAELVVRYQVTINLYNLDVARHFDRTAREMNTTIRVHIKIDSGMGRLGILPDEVTKFFRSMSKLKNIEIEGVFTHFSVADSDKKYTETQIKTFDYAINTLKAGGYQLKYIHAANAPAIINHPEAHYTMVRSGIGLYGLNPSNSTPVPAGFKPAMSWKTTIAQVKRLPAGSFVGYGNTYRTKTAEKIAVIPVGYADGFRRAPAHWGHVLVHGQKAPIVGRVSMDQTMINVSHIDEVKIGDEVVLIGEQRGKRITVDEIAEQLGTINYEIVSTILARVPACELMTFSNHAWLFLGLKSNIEETDYKQKQKLLAALLTALMLIDALYLLISVLMGYVELDTLFFQTVIVTPIFLSLIIYTNHQGYYFISAIAAIGLFTAAVYLVTLVEPQQRYKDDYLVFILIGIILTSIFLSERAILLYAGLNGAILIALRSHYSADVEIEFNNVIYFLLTATTLIVIIVRHQNKLRALEQSRLRDLLLQQEMLLQTAFDGIVILDHTQKVLEVNAALLQLLGYSEKTPLVGKTLFNEPFPTLQSTDWQPFIERSLNNSAGHQLHFELTFRWQYGHFVIAMRNISERKAQERLLVQRADYLSALHVTMLSLMRYHDTEVLLLQILQYAANLVGTKHGSIDLLKNGKISTEIGIGLLSEAKGTVQPLNRGIAHQIYTTKEPLLSYDQDLWRAMIVGDTLPHMLLAVPLLNDDHLVGYISMMHVEPQQTFNADDQELLIQFADLAALALHNARLYEDMHQNQQMLNAIVENTSDLISIKDLYGRYLLFNPAAEQMFNVKGDVIGQKDSDISIITAYNRSIEKQVVESGIAQTYEFFVHHNDVEQYYLTTQFPYFSRESEIKGVVSISRDITAMKEAELAVRNSEAYYRALIKNALDIILIVRRDGRVLFHNASFERILGYSSETIAELQVMSIIHPDDQWAILRYIAKLSEDQPSRLAEFRAQHRDGHWIVLEWHGMNRNNDLMIQGYIITGREITERKAAEDALQDHLRALRSLNDASVQLTLADNFIIVLSELLEAMRYVFPKMSAATIHLINDDKTKLVPARTISNDDTPELMVAFDVADGVAGRAYVENKIVIVDDVAEEAAFYHEPDTTLSYRSLLVVPLMSYSETLGTLSITAKAIGTFDSNDAMIADLLARQTAVLIERVQLFEEEKQQRRLSESLRELSFSLNSAMTLDELFDQVLHHASRVILTEACNIMLLDDDHQVARVVKHWGYTDKKRNALEQDIQFEVNNFPNLMHVIRTKKTLVLADTKEDETWVDVLPINWIRSLASAPILLRGNVIGFLNLDSTIPHFFNEDHAEQLMVFANQIGVAIEKVRLLEAEQRQREISDSLREMSNVLTQSLERDEMLHQFLMHLQRLVPFDAGGIWLVDENYSSYCVANIGYEKYGVLDVIKTMRHELKDTRVLKIMATHQTLVVPNTSLLSDFGEGEFSWIKSWAMTPIVVQGEFIGKVSLDHSQVGGLTDDIVPLLDAAVRQLNIALENLALFEQVQQHAQLLDKRVQQRTAELEQERLQLQAILTSMDEGVILTAWQSEIEPPTIEYVNVSFAKLVDSQLEKIINQPISVLQTIITTPSGQPLEILYDHPVSDWSRILPWRGEVLLHQASGNAIECFMTIVGVQNKKEAAMPWFVAVIRDISHEKRLQAQRARFVANASHELRNPLSNLVTRMYLLKKQPTEQEHLNVMERTITHLTELSQDLLDVTRYNNGVVKVDLQLQDLREIVQAVVYLQNAMATLKQIEIIQDFPDEPVAVMLDRNRFRQVVTNLLVNAISYSPDGASITLQIREEDGMVVLRVDDTGIGIEPDQIAHIFDPFYRASEGKISGTGLGLTIAREIVHLHNGEILVTSTKDAGTQFIVRLPKPRV